MRLLPEIDGTFVPQRLPRPSVGAGHMASHTWLNGGIHFTTLRSLNCYLLNHLRSKISFRFTSALAMAYANPHGVYPVCSTNSLLCASYPTDYAKPSAKTQTGQRCVLLCCLETVPEFHHSHSLLYCLNTLRNSPSPSLPLLLCPLHPPLFPAIPRLRPRMQCYRGSSCGQASRSQISPSGDSSSKELSCDHSLDFRNSRGTPRNPGSAPPSACPPPPYAFSPTPHLHTSAYPSAPHLAFPPFLCQTSQHAEFTFECKFDKPFLWAHVTVTVSEESASLDSLPPVPPGPSTVPHGPTGPSTTKADSTKEAVAQFYSAPSVSLQVQSVEDMSKGKEPTSAAEDRCGDDFGCRIIEEPPSPING